MNWQFIGEDSNMAIVIRIISYSDSSSRSSVYEDLDLPAVNCQLSEKHASVVIMVCAMSG